MLCPAWRKLLIIGGSFWWANDRKTSSKTENARQEEEQAATSVQICKAFMSDQCATHYASMGPFIMCFRHFAMQRTISRMILQFQLTEHLVAFQCHGPGFHRSVTVAGKCRCPCLDEKHKRQSSDERQRKTAPPLAIPRRVGNICVLHCDASIYGVAVP